MIIYMVTNIINNKVYIGKTAYPLKKRKAEHIGDAQKNRYNMVFHKALAKYGEDNFAWEVLDTVLFSDLLIELEKFYIQKYNSKIPNGYNMTDGGEGVRGHKHSEETRRKLSAALKGVRFSDERKKKMHEYMLGRKHSEETKEKLRLAKIGNKWNLGRHPSEETLSKMSLAQSNRSDEINKKISMAKMGHPVSEESRIKMMESRNRYLENHGNYPVSDETREKLRMANLGKHLSDETKRKISLAKIGKPLSEEHKRKLAVAVRPPNTWTKGTHRPEDIKNRISESMKNVWIKRRA